MADQADKSDDLIAELAKLMASNAQGSESRGPATVKVAGPGTPVQTQQRPSIRIPGMDAPVHVGPAVETPKVSAAEAPKAPGAPSAAALATPAPGIRIPGMEPPESLNRPPAPPLPGVTVPPGAPAAAASRPAQPMPAATPSRPAPFPTNAAPRPGFGASAIAGRPHPAVAEKPGPAPVQPVPRFEAPKFAAPQPEAQKIETEPARTESRPEPVAVVVPPPVVPEPAPAGRAPSFDFDFGFGTKEQAGKAPPQPVVESEEDEEPEAPPQRSTAEKPKYDPIAALIAAELDAADQASSPQMPELDLSGLKPPASTVRPLEPLVSPRPAAPRTPRPPESDRFVEPPITAPVASIPEPRRPAPEPVTDIGDPMAEIESLIGEAVRVDLAPQQPPRAAPQPASPPAPSVAPVVPPLGNQLPPRRSALRESDGVEAAELAIAAAAAETARPGRAAPPERERGYTRDRRAPDPAEDRRSPLRPLIGLGLAASLLVAASLGLYWVLNMGRGDGAAPVLVAETGPVKVPPAPAANSGSSAPSSVVFERLDGVASNAAGEQLVPRDETQGADAARVVADAGAAEASDSELASRRVRTVTVRPDGTIVTSENAVAGTSELPVDRPNVPTVPGAVQPPADLLASPTAPRTILPTAGGASRPSGDVALLPTTPAPSAAPAQSYTINPNATLNTALVPPEVAPRIANREQKLAAIRSGQSNPVTAVVGQPSGPQNLLAPAAPASSAPVPGAPAIPVATTGGNAPAYVQLMSLPTEAEARQQAGLAQQRWGSLFGGQRLVIQRAELSGNRVTYRLRLPASSLQNATQICATIKSNGGDCFATNG